VTEKKEKKPYRIFREAMTNNSVPKGRILVVDDDADFFEMTESFLEETYEVSLAISGGRALELLAGGLSPDLILLDVSMPGMDGYETLWRVSVLDHTVGIPVMFLTGINETAAELHLKQGRELKALYRERRKKKKSLPIPPLTPWERKIALLAQTRLASAEIAEAMGTTDRTIRTALSSIYVKLDIHSKARTCQSGFGTGQVSLFQNKIAGLRRGSTIDFNISKSLPHSSHFSTLLPLTSKSSPGLWPGSGLLRYPHSCSTNSPLYLAFCQMTELVPKPGWF
jgi:DNA-binding NarL/FixJ family response regulator